MAASRSIARCLHGSARPCRAGAFAAVLRAPAVFHGAHAQRRRYPGVPLRQTTQRAGNRQARRKGKRPEIDANGVDRVHCGLGATAAHPPASLVWCAGSDTAVVAMAQAAPAQATPAQPAQIGTGVGVSIQPVQPKRSPAHYPWAVLLARIYEVFPMLWEDGRGEHMDDGA